MTLAELDTYRAERLGRFAEQLRRDHEVVGLIELRYATDDVATTRCPVHREETPSFLVDFDKGKYQCFGCGIKGNVDESV